MRGNYYNYFAIATINTHLAETFLIQSPRLLVNKVNGNGSTLIEFNDEEI